MEGKYLKKVNDQKGKLHVCLMFVYVFLDPAFIPRPHTVFFSFSYFYKGFLGLYSTMGRQEGVQRQREKTCSKGPKGRTQTRFDCVKELHPLYIGHLFNQLSFMALHSHLSYFKFKVKTFTYFLKIP